MAEIKMPLSAWKAIRKQALDWARKYHPHSEDLDIRALWDRTLEIARGADCPKDKLIVIMGVSAECNHPHLGTGKRCEACTMTNKVRLRYRRSPK